MNKFNNNELIVKSNQIIEAKYKLNMIEQKIILFLVSLIKKDDEVFKIWKIKVSELSDFLGISSNYAYKELKKSIYNMLKRTLSLQSTNRELHLNWLASADYFNKEGYVELEISEKLKPFLLQLKDNFTKYNIKQVIALKSTYSIRMYELLKQYENIGERFFDIEKLKIILGVSGKYKFYGNFKVRILESAQKELSEKTDIKFTWKPVKTVRKITAIHFSIQKNKIRQRKQLKPESNEIQKLINLIPERHRNKEAVKNVIAKYLKLKGVEYVKKYIDYAGIHANQNYTVYLKRSLKEGWDVEVVDIEKIKKNKRKRQEEEQLKLFDEFEREKKRKLNIKIVENFVPEQERHLRDYIFVQKNNKDVNLDKQNKREQYKKVTLVAHIERYLISIVDEYIKSLNGGHVQKEQVLDWVKGYTKIKEIEIFDWVFEDKDIKKHFC